MVERVYVEKKAFLRHTEEVIRQEIYGLLGIPGVRELRILNRYDVEGLCPEEFQRAVQQVLSEPQMDEIFMELPEAEHCFAVEYLPGQYDQRADSAEQCIQLLLTGERPKVRTARVYLLFGELSEEELQKIKDYLINPVEAREAGLGRLTELSLPVSKPLPVEELQGFCEKSKEELSDFLSERDLAMDLEDLCFVQGYFREERRDPTITEIRMIDTYWSDHCRHTTFLTTLEEVHFEDRKIQKAYERYLRKRQELGRTKPINFMDIATLAARVLKKKGKLSRLDESEEINACTVKIDVEMDGKKEPWLLLFKNETHNHPTEIEPFGGAATCIGGAIRDPLSGRAYVYQAMRVSGAADPTVPLSETLEGKLPQRKIVTGAADGYSSYGNQIGLATGQVTEIYHPRYVAKRMELGAVVAAAPAENVRREVPEPGDRIILLGGRTGRDGIGGATGSSKAHHRDSLDSCGAEVQKGNAIEERKLQRLFRNGNASRLIKRCNDFGAGGVSVAIGELADGLFINLNQVPKKYEGLDGTELAISESQERMAVVVARENVDSFLALAGEENLEGTVVAEVTEEKRLRIQWNDSIILDLSRDFLNSNGAEKHTRVTVPDFRRPGDSDPEHYREGAFVSAFRKRGSFREKLHALSSDLNIVSQRGLSERFDSTVGAGTVLMPFGGKYQKTPALAMAARISSEEKDTELCSLMAYGYEPYLMERDPYTGAYLAVLQSLCKLIASGCDREETYLSFQEYFGKPGEEEIRWGIPLSALLGAFDAQLDYEVAAIGGKDSMSGSFDDLDVPPTLVSFAVTTAPAKDVLSPEFKKAGHSVLALLPQMKEGIAEPTAMKALFTLLPEWNREGRIASLSTLGYGGMAEQVFKSVMGNGFGFRFSEEIPMEKLFREHYGSFLLELSDGIDPDTAKAELMKALPTVGIRTLGVITKATEEEQDEGAQEKLCYGTEEVELSGLYQNYEERLASVFPMNTKSEGQAEDTELYEEFLWQAPAVTREKPRVLIPVFPGNNCETDVRKSCLRAGLDAEILLVRNRDRQEIQDSILRMQRAMAESQILVIPGGFSGGDEPDGSAKFITSFFRNERIRRETMRLLRERDGLILGICNGFQALIKLGLLPYGEIRDTDEHCPTLAMNTIGRHQSKIVNTRVTSNLSPWLMRAELGKSYKVAVSHGEGRFLCEESLYQELVKQGQIATQYADLSGCPTMEIQYNPNGSLHAVEGITSADGRIYGKMGHIERFIPGNFKNVPGCYEMELFESAKDYFEG